MKDLSRRLKKRFFPLLYLRQIEKDERSLGKERDAKRLLRFKQTLQWAGRTVPYYRETFKVIGFDPGRVRCLEDLSKIPVLTKSSIQADPTRFISEKVPESKRQSQGTTGSSGRPLQVWMTKEEELYSHALVLYGFLKSGARPGMRLAIVRNASPALKGVKKVNRDIFQWYVLDLKNELDEILKQLNELKPEILYSYPSWLSLLSRHLLDKGFRIYKPSFVFTHGEGLTPEVRSLIRSALGCPVRNSYGSTEFYRMAYECGEEKLHILETPYVLETVMPQVLVPGDHGEEIIVTSLYHRAMPFIRYRLGDRIVKREGRCGCGAEGPIIEEVTGRSDDFLVLPSERRVSARAVNLLDDIPGILEYQIIQKEKHRLEVRVRPGSEFDETIEQRIKEKILEGCGGEPVEVNVLMVDQILRLPNGKLSAVISEIRP